MSTQREASRKEWTGDSIQNINSGSLQRIADACEKMAASYDTVREERDRYEGYWKNQLRLKETLNRRVSSLRGVITKLKRERKS